MLDKYIKINDKLIISGQDKDKLWFCKEFPSDNTKDVDKTIKELNKIYNEANKNIIGKKKEDKNI